VEKHGRIIEPKDDNIIWRMPIACWVTKDTDKNSKYLILKLFHVYNGYANSTKYYIYMHIACLFILSGTRCVKYIANSDSKQAFRVFLQYFHKETA
jgi:hypothetical protein